MFIPSSVRWVIVYLNFVTAAHGILLSNEEDRQVVKFEFSRDNVVYIRRGLLLGLGSAKGVHDRGQMFPERWTALSLHFGSFHYWRQPPEYWEDTFLKMRAAGLNAVQT